MQVRVGMTGLMPEERFANHKAGTKAASVVKRYGLRLLPELYEHLNPMPFEAAGLIVSAPKITEGVEVRPTPLATAGVTVTGPESAPPRPAARES